MPIIAMVCRASCGAKTVSAARRNCVASAASDLAALPCQKTICNLPHFGVRSADFFQARIFLAQQIQQSGRRIFGRILKFDEGVWLAFFGGPALQIGGMRDVRIVIVQALHFLI